MASRRGQGPLEDLPLLPGDVFSTAVAIANDGTIVGTTTTNAVFWPPSGPVRVLPRLRDLTMSPAAINSRGLVVGTANSENIGAVPWVFDVTTNQLSELPFPAEWQAAAAEAINDAGEIVGYVYSASTSGIVYAARWTAGSHEFSVLPLPPDETGGSQAFAINASGTIVGKIHDRAALWPPNAGPSFLPTGRCGNGTATAINDDGVVVGQLTGGTDGCDEIPSPPARSFPGGGPRPPPTFAVRWNVGRAPIDMGPPYSFATAINGRGVAVGYLDWDALRWLPPEEP